MKIACFTRNSVPGIGNVEADGSIVPFDLSPESAARGIASLLEIGSPSSLPQLAPIAACEIELRAPMPRPQRNIFCVGKNYHEHAKEFSASGFDSSAASGVVPKEPIIFSKLPETVIGTGQPIRIDASVSKAIDYEAELAVIIGKQIRGATRENALDFVWGYTIVNDVTARDLQGKYSQWLIGKSQDTFCPMGPIAVTADAFDPQSARIRCLVNGELRQDASISDLIFDIPRIISTISAGITLQPGDIIATGTPAGVGIGFTPPRYLVPGDNVRIEVDGIGVLENPVVAYGNGA
ncbi:MAG: fumarylacetoacetate hydrolase family protein [Nitratireductor sp.]|nr:fumarylacetoacetate hydrolase family protein [Nitratireductor sp.]